MHNPKKQKRICRGLILSLSIFCLLLPQGLALGAPPGNPSDWVMTFNDEFDGTSLDLSKWDTKYIFGTRTLSGNSELEWYVDDAAHHVVSDGTLKLIATKESSQSGYPYTSGMISSHKSFSQAYGYFEASMKLPAGRGLWPAFWLLPTPAAWPPEIDVMENLGHDTRTVYMTNHYTSGGSHASTGTSYNGPDFSAGFHTFGLEWSFSAIVWYIDGVERYRLTSNIPSGKMHAIVNLAVGGSWPGAPDASTVFPNQLEIDYIRVYSRGASPDTTPPANPTNLRKR